MRTQCHRMRLAAALAAVLAVSAVGSGRAGAQTITEIIDATGDGAGNILTSPFGIAVDAVGNAYVVGASSHNAFRITPTGVITEIIDCTGDGAGNTLVGSRGIALDAAGNAYVVGVSSNNAFKITPTGVITEIIDATGDGAGNVLGGPAGIAVDATGNVYVTAVFSDNAFKITPAGVITEIINAAGDGAGNVLDGPQGVAVDGAGNAYVVGVASNNAFKIAPGGFITEIIDCTGDGAGNGLGGPERIAVDGSGNVYMAGASTNNAFKITPAGLITEIIDCTGDGTGDCTFFTGNALEGAVGIAVDGSGNVYVTGGSSDNAFKITPAGVITEIIDCTGDGTGDCVFFTGNDLRNANSITADGAGNAYVTGQFSRNAFKITPTPSCTLQGDLNQDGVTNGDDIDGFVRSILGLPPEPGQDPTCADFGTGTLEGDTAAFIAALLN